MGLGLAMNTCGSHASPTPLLAPPDSPRHGSTREGLHSLLRRLCEYNQLTVNDVLAGLILPSLGACSKQLTRMSVAVHLINRGCEISQKFAERIQALTTIKSLSVLTLSDLVSLRGLGTLAISSHRKWCAECLNEDLETELGSYDRLLWSIDDVHACPIHNVQLKSTCQSCGSGPFAILTGRDISGRCPKCLGWLGGESIALDQTRDEYSRYLLWIAKSYADLLDSSLPSHIDIRPGFRKIVIALTERHFCGVVAQFSSAIERNRSVVTTWLLGRASPSWRALCEISYVFQIPLLELLTGQTNAVELSTVQRLPLVALKRLTSPRKLPEKRELNDVIFFLAKVERGELPNVLTMKEVGNRIGIHPRELSRIVPEDAAQLSILLANRRAQIREKKKIYREQVLREEVPAAVSRLLQEGIRPTRRAVDKALAFAGIPVRRHEAPFVRELVQLTLGDKTSLSVSGN